MQGIDITTKIMEALTMRISTRALVAILSVLIALPVISFAGDHAKKFGVEFIAGGSYFNMADVNDFIPTNDFLNIDPEKLHIGSQFGIGLLYRHMENFGWQFGYSRMFGGVPVVLEEKYRVERFLGNSQEASYAEHVVSGVEFYAMATWYKPMGEGELMFGLGPALYKASLDRNIYIKQDANSSPIGTGSFVEAKGKSFGMVGAVGYEMMLKPTLGLSLQFGGRIAKVSKLHWEDPRVDESEEFVMLNTYSNSTLPVDFTGGFGKITLRAYFKPSSNWRTHKL